MKKNHNEQFQDSIDELLTLEQKADRRADKLIEITNNQQNKNQQAIDNLIGKINRLDTSLAKINNASDQISDYASQSKKHVIRTTKLFIKTMIGCVLLMVGTLWLSHWIISKQWSEENECQHKKHTHSRSLQRQRLCAHHSIFRDHHHAQ